MDAIPLSAMALDEPAMKSTAAPKIGLTNPMIVNNAVGNNLVVVIVAIELTGHVAGIIVHVAHVQNVALHFRKQIVLESVLAVVAIRRPYVADLTKYLFVERVRGALVPCGRLSISQPRQSTKKPRTAVLKASRGAFPHGSLRGRTLFSFGGASDVWRSSKAGRSLVSCSTR